MEEVFRIFDGWLDQPDNQLNENSLQEAIHLGLRIYLDDSAAYVDQNR
jgi:hypothetical protein